MSEYLGACDVEHHPHKDTPGIATHIHKRQLEDARAEVRQLRAENAALKAQLGTQAWRRDTPEGDLLIALAEEFDILHAFADAAPGAQTTDHTKTGRQKPHSLEPKGGDRRARHTLKELIRGVESRIETSKNRRENDFEKKQVDLDPPGPKTRCWTRGCSQYSRTIREEACPGCGKRVANDESQDDQPSARNAAAVRA